jgi:hypothetical protein
MLTDDDLTRSLGSAFQDATEGLTYTGRTRPPRQVLSTVLPAVTAAAVLTGAAVAAIETGHHSTPAVGAGVRPAPHHPSSTAVSHPAKKTLVTRKVRLAGFTITYQAAAGSPLQLYAEVGFSSVPDSATPVTTTNPNAKTWIGTESSTGDNALYVQFSDGNSDQLYALVSPTWTQQQLINAFESPMAVPEVSAGSGS